MTEQTVSVAKSFVVESIGSKSFGKNDCDVLKMVSSLEITNTRDAIDTLVKSRGLRHFGTSVADNAKSIVSITLTIDTNVLTAVPDSENPVNWIIAGKTIAIVDSDNVAKRADLTSEKILRELLASAGLIERSTRGLSEEEKVTREIEKLTAKETKRKEKETAREEKLKKQMQELSEKRAKLEKEAQLRLESLKTGKPAANSADKARSKAKDNRHTA